MHRDLSADVICSKRRTVFREHGSKDTVSFKEQILSEDKYPSTFSLQMEAIMLSHQFIDYIHIMVNFLSLVFLTISNISIFLETLEKPENVFIV